MPVNPADDDASSASSVPISYHGGNTGREDQQDEMLQLHKTVSRSVNSNTDNNVLTRLSTLSHTLSHLSYSQMQTFAIDPEDFDLKRVLNFLNRRNEQQGLKQKKTDVVYENLTVLGKNTSAAMVQDVKSTFLPFLDLLSKKKKLSVDLSKMSKTRKIIRGVSGFAIPGTMTLVLGRPGAGCSTFLKSVGGEMQTYTGMEGEIEYDGIPYDQMVKGFKNQLIYVPELDDHFPFLTVEETLKFAIGCKTPAVRVNGVSRSEYISTIKDLYTVLFGLHHVEKTLVGNDFVRGISGGQRKRVSIAEAMATGGTVFCYDNATRGLDASTALEFVEALRTSTNITQTTSFVTAYQASENIYKLFDYVTVLYLGRQIFFGTAADAVSYFERMGFVKGSRQTSSEYLTAVTDPLERKALPGFETKVPQTADDFEQYWQKSPEYAAMQETISQMRADASPEATKDLFKDVHSVERQKWSGAKSQYTVNFLEQLKLCATRGVRNIVNNKGYTITQIVVAIVQALVVGSLYYNISSTTAGAFSRGGTIFFGLFYFVVMALAEISAVFENKPILNKQRGYTLYHPSAELLSTRLVKLPVTLLSATLFTIIIYFLAGLKQTAGAFFIFLLFVILTVEAVDAIFILMSSITPNVSAANGLAGIFMLMILLYSSFMIQRPSMYWWFRWFSYMNPILYGFEAIISSEFHNVMMRCDPTQLIPSGPSYSSVTAADQVCAFVGADYTRHRFPGHGNDVNGDAYVALSFDYFFSHVWRNLGILFTFIIGVLFVNSLLVEYYNPITATSDKLQFVRGAQIPTELLTMAEGSDDDPEKNSSSSSSSTAATTAVVAPKANPDESLSLGDKLGSGDVFMWKHVNYVVPYEGQQRKLLDDVQGYVLPGTLTALMGESGAGKTTLLNVLSQRVDMGVVTGDFLINGHPLDSSFARRTGYVQQQDIHIAELTVRESLLFAARLRRPRSVPDSEKVEYVDKIMRILHMEEYADAIAGLSGYGLNVEQRKKLSIATELVAKPSLLLFLDEPTSGLDSQSAWAIVQVLRQLAKAGQAILCTIHQPSATLFEQFDRLLLLQRGGITTYFGPIGHNSETVVKYFESHGGRDCAHDENSAEYILDVIGAGATASSSQNWGDVWAHSKEFQQVSSEVDRMIEETSHKTVDQEQQKELQEKFAAPYLYQLAQVLRRTSTQFYRDMDYVVAKFMLMVLAGLIHGFSFWKLKHTIIGNQNGMFANFMAIVLCAPLTNQIMARAMQSRELFEVRESKSNTFHWSTLLISQYLVEIPYSVVFATIYFICWYFPIQLPLKASVAGFWWMNYVLFFQFYYVSLALAVVYFSPDLPTADVFLGLIFNFVVGFCGVVQSPGLMPGFWKFMWRVSPFTYFVENLLSTTLHNREIRCSATEMNYLDPPEGSTCGEYLGSFFESHTGYVANPDATSHCGVCQFSVGDEYLASVSVFYSHRWRNIGLFCVYILFNLAIMLGLYYLFRVRGVSLPEFNFGKKKKAEESKPVAAPEPEKAAESSLPEPEKAVVH